MKPEIKAPTLRKIKNRGFEPVIWHGPNQIVSGWIYKTGRKYLHFYSPSAGRKRLAMSERKHMRPPSKPVLFNPLEL